MSNRLVASGPAMECADLEVFLMYTVGARMGDASTVGRVALPPGGRGGF